jgi:hypothetical protein
MEVNIDKNLYRCPVVIYCEAACSYVYNVFDKRDHIQYAELWAKRMSFLYKDKSKNKTKSQGRNNFWLTGQTPRWGSISSANRKKYSVYKGSLFEYLFQESPICKKLTLHC